MRMRPVLVRRAARLLAGLLACTTATAVSAQSFNQAVTRYRAQKSECERVYRERVAQACDTGCVARAEQVRTRCLARAEDRYGRAIRQALRSRR